MTGCETTLRRHGMILGFLSGRETGIDGWLGCCGGSVEGWKYDVSCRILFFSPLKFCFVALQVG